MPATPDRASGEHGWSSLFEFLPIGAYRNAPDGHPLHANPALARLNGFATVAEHLQADARPGRPWYVDPGRRAQFRALLERDGVVAGFESEVRRYASGERIWVRENAHVVRDALGEALFYEGTIEDITAQVRAREALVRSGAELQQIVDLVPGVVYRVLLLPDGGRRATFVSSGVRALLGLEPEDFLRDGSLMHRLRHPDDRARIEALTAERNGSGASTEIEHRMLLPDGRVKWVHVLSAAAPPEQGLPVRVGMMFDITARKHSEQALQAQAEVWKRAIEATGDGVWEWNIVEGTGQLSPQCKALYGYAPDELPDSPAILDTLTHPDDKPAMHAAREAHFSGRAERYVNEHRVRCKDGSWKWILTRGLLISRAADGRPLRIVGTHTDITPARQAEALRLERDRAAAADVAKSQFLSRVSHELRTPLNAILGFGQLLELESAGMSERQQGWVRQGLASGRHLLALLDDVLDLSSAQTGQLAVQAAPVLLRPVFEEAWAMLARDAAARSLTLHDEVDAGVTLLADRKRLTQVVSNLLSNAIKYNRPGGWVRIASRLVAGDTAEFSVADGGPGLSAEQQARLFNPFDRLGAERSAVQGTGLGLALTRQLLDAMGGTISVRSAPGEGSAFSVRLRLAGPPQARS